MTRRDQPEWIPPWDLERRVKAAYVVGAISFAQFSRLMDITLRRPASYEVSISVPFGSELEDRLRVKV